MKIIINILLISFAGILISCNSESVAEISGTVYKIPHNPPVGKDINHDITRIKKLYSKFNFIATIVVKNNKIAPNEIHEINRIIDQLKCYELVYSQKFFENKIEKTAFAVLMNDPSTYKIISDYIYLTKQLQLVEGSQFLNL